MIFALIILAAAFGVAVQIAGIAYANANRARGCTCSKNAVSPTCPVHGWDR